MKFLKDGLSIDEFKSSSLVIMFIIFSIVAIVQYILTGDITNNWLDLLNTLILVIGGVNVVKGVTKFLPNGNDKEVKKIEGDGKNGN